MVAGTNHFSEQAADDHQPGQTEPIAQLVIERPKRGVVQLEQLAHLSRSEAGMATCSRVDPGWQFDVQRT
jgi:hypothetical protein